LRFGERHIVSIAIGTPWAPIDSWEAIRLGREWFAARLDQDRIT
jgi:hypothetical protein